MHWWRWRGTATTPRCCPPAQRRCTTQARALSRPSCVPASPPSPARSTSTSSCGCACPTHDLALTAFAAAPCGRLQALRQTNGPGLCDSCTQADRLEELGAAEQVAGKHLWEGPVEAAASRLAGSLGRVLRSGSMRARCVELQARLALEDGAAVASRHIREVLQTVQRAATLGVEVFHLANGWPVRAASLAEAVFLHEEIFVQQCYLQHGLALRPGDVVVDVGANIGAAKGFPQCCPAQIAAVHVAYQLKGVLLSFMQACLHCG